MSTLLLPRWRHAEIAAQDGAGSFQQDGNVTPLSRSGYAGLPGSVEHLARPRRCYGAVFKHDFAVDDDDWDTFRILVRVLERGCIAHALRIEHHEISLHAGRDRTALLQSEALRRERRHLAHRVFERQHLAVPHIDGKYARERAVAARVGEAGALGADAYDDPAVRRNHREWMPHDSLDVGLAQQVASYPSAATLFEQPHSGL